MAETPDRESKTEEPTDKRLGEAFEKGNVPVSREAITFGSFASLLIVCVFFATWSAGHIGAELRGLLAISGDVRLEDREGVAVLGISLLGGVALGILPVVTVLAGGTVLASLLQNVPSVALERITPRLSRISPAAGWKRVFGRAGLVEFLKAVLKLMAVSLVTTLTVHHNAGEFLKALQTDPQLLMAMVVRLGVEIIAALCVISFLLALADLAWSRHKWRRELRMTKQEVKEEVKQAEGDPHLKARVRSVARQRSSRKMLAKLPQATVVITNPTHYAVALRYTRQDGSAPIVLAKGVDFLALKIREIAEGQNVPLIENRPLARALYDKVEIDCQIPPEFYRAVAEIIHFLHNRRRPVTRPAKL